MLLDTNILLDVVLDRRPFSVSASELLKLFQERNEAAYVAWHSVSILYYVVSRDLGDSEARDFILEISRFISVPTTSTEDLLLRCVAADAGLRGRHAGGGGEGLRR